MNWQPIKTAPRIDTRIILFRKGWAESMCIGYYSDYTEDFVAVSGATFLDATHWMPLPEVPQ